MELTFKGVDISTEEKFVSYINSLNTAIMKQNAMNEIKQDLYDVSYSVSYTHLTLPTICSV